MHIKGVCFLDLGEIKDCKDRGRWTLRKGTGTMCIRHSQSLAELEESSLKPQMPQEGHSEMSEMLRAEERWPTKKT